MKSLGGLDATRQAIIQLLPELNRGIHREAQAKYGRFFSDGIAPLDAPYTAEDVNRYQL